jgi:hypothetical protein
MKHFWIGLVAAGVLSLAGAQTASTSGSASANANVSPGQAGAGASAGQNAQAGGASANAGANAAGNAQVSGEPKARSGEEKPKHESGSGSHGKGNGGNAAASGGSASLAQGSMLHTELTKPVDCKKAKPGDEVTAKVTEDMKSDGKVVVHKGSKVVGHVTEVQAKDKEHADSKLGIAFDKIVAHDGQETAFNGVVQAIAPPSQVLANAAASQGAGVDAPMGGGGGRAPAPAGGGHAGGGLVGGATSTVGATAGAATGAVGTVGNVGGAVGGTVHGATGGLTSQGTLTSASRGVFGLEGVNLSSATGAAGSAQGSLITSPTRNIKLDSGTQVLLQAAGSADAAGSVAK